MARLDGVNPNDFRYWDRVPIGIQPGEMERMRVPGMATGRTQPVVRAMVASPAVLRNAGAVYEVDTVPVPVRPPPELPVAYEVETMSTPDIDSLSRGPIEWRSILARGLLFLGLGTGVTFIVLLIENAATNVPDPKEQKKKMRWREQPGLSFSSLPRCFSSPPWCSAKRVQKSSQCPSYSVAGQGECKSRAQSWRRSGSVRSPPGRSPLETIRPRMPSLLPRARW